MSSTTPAPRKRTAKKVSAPPAPVEEATDQVFGEEGVSSVSDFKKKSTARRGVVPLPSGARARLSSPGMTAFITRGLIPNPLLEIIQEAMESGESPDPETLFKDEEGNLEKERMAELIQLIDAVTCEVMVEPKCYSVPTQKDLKLWNQQNPRDRKQDPEELRRADRLYVDDVDDMDKMYIWQWSIGGVEKLAQFREELATDLGAVAAGQGSAQPPERTSRTRAR